MEKYVKINIGINGIIKTKEWGVKMTDKKFIKRRYNLSLLNVDPKLDLILRSAEIKETITRIASGCVKGYAYNDVESIVIRKVTKRNIQLECKESDKIWHRKLGRELAQNSDMRQFCYKDSKNNEELMFEWI